MKTKPLFAVCHLHFICIYTIKSVIHVLSAIEVTCRVINKSSA